MWRLLLLVLPLSALTYTLWRVWQLLPLPMAWRWAIVILCGACFFMLFPAMLRTLDVLPAPMARTIYYIGTGSLPTLLYCTLLFLVLDLLRIMHILPAHALRDNAWTTIAITLFLVALFVYGNINYYHKRRQEISLTTTKRIGGEIKLLLASDLHLGFHIRRGELHQWVNMINSEKPDIVLLAGDLADRSIKPLRDEGMAEELRRIAAPVFACPGNHEYYCGIAQAEEFYKEAGITLLRDSAATIGGLTVAGRDDRTNPKRKSVAALLKDIDKNTYVILLDHQPYNLERSAAAGVDFQFSGHTHHGQFFPASLVTDAVYTVAHGEYAIGATRYFVSSGLGIWGAKFRIGTCSEYAVATIKNE